MKRLIWGLVLSILMMGKIATDALAHTTEISSKTQTSQYPQFPQTVDIPPFDDDDDDDDGDGTL